MGKAKRTRTAWIMCILLCLALILASCGGGSGNSSGGNNSVTPGGNNSAPSDPKGNDHQSNTENNSAAPAAPTEKEIYDMLSAACAEVRGSQCTSLYISKETRTEIKVSDSGETTTAFSQEVFETDFYAGAGGGLDFVRLALSEKGEPLSGMLQKDGVRYDYFRMEREGRKVEWTEGPAQTGCLELAVPDSLIYDIPAFGYISSISLDGNDCGLKLSDSTPLILSQDAEEASSYEIKDMSAVYKLGAAGKLASCEWVYTEILTEENNTRTDNVRLKIEITSGTPRALTWFADNTTYVRPQYTDVTADWRVFYVNIPGKIIFDVHVPKIKDDLPGAAEINAVIADDLGYDLESTEESLKEEDFDGYVVYRTDYEVYRFGSYYEILVTTDYGSAYGSGMVTKINKYVYDAATGSESDMEAFLEKMGYTKESFLSTAYDMDEYTYILGRHLTDAYSYEELLYRYYFDKDGQLRFIVDAGY